MLTLMGYALLPCDLAALLKFFIRSWLGDAEMRHFVSRLLLWVASAVRLLISVAMAVEFLARTLKIPVWSKFLEFGALVRSYVLDWRCRPY